MPEETQQERELRDAEDRGRLNEKLEQHFRDDERRFTAIGGDVAETKRDVKSVKGEVRKLAEEIREDRAVKSALAEHTKQVIDQQVTTKQLVIGLLGAVAGVGILLVSALTLVGHA